MKKKILFIVIPIVLAIIIVGIVAIAVISSILNKNKSVGTTWGDTYYAYLKEAINEKDLSEAEEKFGMQLGMKDAKIGFYDIEENENPSMVMTYSKDENNYVNVYQINNDNKVTYVAYKQPSEAEYLYNIENENYNWYIHEKSSTSDSYILLKNIVDKLKNNSDKSEKSNNVNIAEIQADYTIKKDEAEISQETADGNKIRIKKFDQIFIKPEIEPNEQIDFNIDIKEDDLKKSITNVVKNFKKESEKLTNEVKESVQKKVEEFKETAKKIEEEKEEVRKKEEEAKKKAEEEAKGLQVGKHTLKYGTYISDVTQGNKEYFGTITLKPDGKFYIKSNYDEKRGTIEKINIDCDGTYEVKLNQPTGYPNDYADYISFKPEQGNNFSFEVCKDNSFSDDYHGYSYSENGNTTTTEKSTNSSNNGNNANNSNVTQKSESNLNNNSNMPTDHNAISKDEALKLAQNKWGTYAEETGYQIGYEYVAWIKDNNGKEYYVFILRWLVVDHWSYIDTVCVCTDGKTYKEIGSPESYTDGQLVTSFDSEGNF